MLRLGGLGLLNLFSVVVVVLDDMFFVSFREVFFWVCVCLMFFLRVFWVDFVVYEKTYEQ